MLGVVSLIPLVGAIGLIVCGWQRITLPAVYFKLFKEDSVGVYFAMIAISAIQLFTIIAWPVTSSCCWRLASGILSTWSSIAIMLCGLKPLERTANDYCSDGGHNATSIFRDLFTDDINTEAYYDVLEMRYLTSTHGGYSLADRAGKWAAKQCMVGTTTFVIFYSMAVSNIVVGGFMTTFASSWRDLIRNSEYRRIDGEVIHETIDISK